MTHESFRPKRPLVVGVGGTGIIGNALLQEVGLRGFDYLSVSLDPPEEAPGTCNLSADATALFADGRAEDLERHVSGRHVVAVVDILGLKGSAREGLSRFAEKAAAPVGVLSSCMLYDHDGSGPVDETAPTLTYAKAAFPYQRSKLMVEHEWQDAVFDDWLIFRTNHVLGKGAVLGCIPAHNRDLDLRRRILRGDVLNLAHGGDVWLSFIHPRDLASILLDLLTESRFRTKIVNAVHPRPVQALQYYQEVARQLDRVLAPPNLQQPDSADFWSVTARNNIFKSHYAELNGREYRYGLAQCVSDALSSSAEVLRRQRRFMDSRIGIASSDQ